jgi:hypothetical protein
VSQATIHHPSSYGYSGQVGLPATITGGVSATFSWQQLDPSAPYTVIWGDASGNGSFTSSATGTGSLAHTYANGTYTQTVTDTNTGQIEAKRTFTVPYAGGGGFAPRSMPPPPDGGEQQMVQGQSAPANGNGDYFDPADYTIDEVMAWIEDNPDELENLIAAEEAGKARVTLLAQLNDLR